MIAESQHTPDRFERAIAAIHALIGERGVGRHVLFGEVNEGTIFPDGTEALSGHVVDEQDRVYFFWTEWDTRQRRPVFTIWRDVTPEPRWLANDEYLQARRTVGLDRPASRLV